MFLGIIFGEEVGLCRERNCDGSLMKFLFDFIGCFGVKIVFLIDFRLGWDG